MVHKQQFDSLISADDEVDAEEEKMTEEVKRPPVESTSGKSPLHRRLTDLNIDKIKAQGNRLALVSDLW